MKNLILTFITILIGITASASVLVVDSLNNSGTGSLRSQIALAASGDTIRFNPNLIANGSDSIVLSSVISFSKNLTLVGLYTPTDTLFISGGQNNKILFADSTQFVILDSLVLRNADTAAFSISVIDSIVIKNSFLNGNQGGGAYLFYFNSLTVHNCQFNRNSGGFSAFFKHWAHILPINQRYARITNSTFNSNQGYGFSASDYDSLDILIDGCEFNNNVGDYKGGGLLIKSGRPRVVMRNSKISNNTALWGAGLHIESFHYAPMDPVHQFVDIENSTVSNNVATHQGGGVYVKCYSNFPQITRRLRISHSTFSNNSVTDTLGVGGAIFSSFGAGDSISDNKFIIEYSTFSGNTSLYEGGAIYSESRVNPFPNTNSMYLKNTTITGNNSNSGGGICVATTHMPSIQELHITSSIIALNGDSNIVHHQNQTMVSGGYNIFSDSNITGINNTDQMNATAAELNFAPLSFYGGFTQTIMPMNPSIAKDSGNPIDTTNAQNHSVFGSRDVGAAEICNSSEIDVVTACVLYDWVNGNTFKKDTLIIDTLISSMGCDSVVTLDLTILEVDTSVNRSSLTLTAQAPNATYQWIDCDKGIMPNETSADFTATQNGNYQVEVTQNGCVDTSACFSITNVGMEQTQLLGVNVYPNPTSDVLHIDKGSNVSLEITVTNSVGSIVYNSSTKDQITTIEMAKMASGVYVVTLRNELGVSVERIVKR